MVTTSAVAVARTYLGVEELEGVNHNPQILGWLRQIAPWASGDEIAWCSAWACEVARRLGLPHPNSLSARSWLAIGKPISLHDARPEEDVVIFKRGRGKQPGPEVLDAPGHVAWFLSLYPGVVEVIGGNQSDAVTVARFPQADVLGVRRLAA